MVILSIALCPVSVLAKFFSAWPSHLARLALLFLSGCALFFRKFLSLVFISTLYNFRARIKIVVVVVVVLFYPQKWSGKWVEFNSKWPNRDVTLLPWVYLRCQSFLLTSERICKKTCPAIPNWVDFADFRVFPPSLPLSFLLATLRERLWQQSDVRSWYHLVFWPRDSNTILRVTRHEFDGLQNRKF